MKILAVETFITSSNPSRLNRNHWRGQEKRLTYKDH
jgi:hypothetical protein